MNLRQLELLRAIMRCETTVGAARELGLSQPSVSNALKNLESQLGFPLFDRVNNRLFPTEAARVIQHESDSIFSLHQALEVKIDDLKENRAGLIRIVATPPLAHSVIPQALQAFRRRNSKVRVVLDVTSIGTIADNIEKSISELGFGLGAVDHESMISEVFFSKPLVCVFRKGLALEKKAVVTPADLRPYPLISLDRANRLGFAVREAFKSVDEEFNFAVEVRYSNTACSIAETGVGVAIVDQLSAYLGGYKDLEVRPFEPVTPISAFVMQSRNRPLSRMAAMFLKDVRSIASKIGGELG